MKKTALQIYLHDHLAGAAFAVELLRRLRDRHRDEETGTFAAKVLAEVEADLARLRELSGRVETRRAGLKESVARLLERFSRLKLRRGRRGEVGLLETLETLYLGIRGKEALWTALAAVDGDPRLAGIDYAALAERARRQAAQVDAKRLETARRALGAH